MKIPVRDIKLSETKTISAFVDWLRENRSANTEKLSPQTIHYHLKNTNRLDWVDHFGMKLIVMNNKAKSFDPGSYYHKPSRVSKDTF